MFMCLDGMEILGHYIKRCVQSLAGLVDLTLLAYLANQGTSGGGSSPPTSERSLFY